MDQSRPILITGAEGFVGGYLVKHLLTQGYQQVHGTFFNNSQKLQQQLPSEHCHQADLTDLNSVVNLLNHLQPQAIVHLAAQSAVGSSFEKSWEVINNNARLEWVMNEAVRQSELSVRLLSISSAQVYGLVDQPLANQPIPETTSFNPTNPYAVSKIAQESIAKNFHNSYGLNTIIVRPFNQIGPGQLTEFAVASFASQIAKIEKGQQAELRVGNLSAQRDFTDVRDAVVAYELLLNHGQAGDVYNLGSQQVVAMQTIVDELVALSSTQIQVVVDPNLVRPVDIPRFGADSSKLRQLGWQPQITLEQTLSDILEYERNKE